MTKTSKIVFFGSGPVAAKSLEQLQTIFDIEAIVTKPSTLREMQAITTAPVHAVSSRTELDQLIDDQHFTSSVGVLIDFGIIVSQKVIDYFPKGIVNSHFSLLPEWRGADPLTFSILSGQKRTGVSLMLLVAAMDEGPLLSQIEYEIKENETTPTLTEELINLSTHSLERILPLWLTGETVAKPQEQATIADNKTPTYSRKLTKADGKIDWTKPAEQIEREIRAYAGWPRSYTTFGSVKVIIHRAHAVPSQDPEHKPGDLEIMADDGILMVTTGNGTLCIESIQPEGKKEMPVAAFLNGYSAKLV